MGDSGSMFLGLLLAASAITLTGQIDPNAISAEKLGPTLLPLMLPFAVLAIPLIDLFSAIVRRLRAGQSRIVGRLSLGPFRIPEEQR